MDIRRILVLFVCVGGIYTSIIEPMVVENNCGILTIVRPIVYSRNVSVTFRPKDAENAHCSLLLRNNKLQVEQRNMTKYNDVYKYTIQNLNRTLADILARCYYRRSNSHLCDSAYGQMQSATTLTGCGLLYMYKRPPVLEGDKVELRYMPSDAIITSTSNYIRSWMIRRKDSTKETLTIDGPRTVEREIDFNHEYGLTISNIKEDMSGNISLRCTTGRDYDKTTAEVPILVTVKPDRPRFSKPATADFNNCRGCMYGYLGKVLTVTCVARGGTKPVTANIRVGGIKEVTQETEEGIFSADFTLVSADHLKDVQCEVTNPAVDTDSPLVVSRQLFVIKEPTIPPALTIGPITEGQPANIQCVSENIRPPAKLEFTINNRTVKSETTSTLDGWDYKSVGRLDAVERRWNTQLIKCCASHERYSTTKCSAPTDIRYIFGPESVRLFAINPPSELASFYVYDLECAVENVNPVCGVKLDGIPGIESSDQTRPTEGGLSLYHRWTINVTDADQGRSVECIVFCRFLKKTYASTYIIALPGAQDNGSTSAVWIGVGVGVVVLLLIAGVTVLACIMYRKKRTKEHIPVSVHRASYVNQQETLYDDPDTAKPESNPAEPCDPAMDGAYASVMPTNHRPTQTGGSNSSVQVNSTVATPGDEYAVVIPKNQRPPKQSEDAVSAVQTNTAEQSGPTRDDEYAIVIPKNQRPSNQIEGPVSGVYANTAEQSGPTRDDEYAIVIPKNQRPKKQAEGDVSDVQVNTAKQNSQTRNDEYSIVIPKNQRPPKQAESDVSVMQDNTAVQSGPTMDDDHANLISKN